VIAIIRENRKSDLERSVENVLQHARLTAAEIGQGRITKRTVRALRQQLAFTQAKQAKHDIESCSIAEIELVAEVGNLVANSVIEMAYLLKIDAEPLLDTARNAASVPWRSACAKAKFFGGLSCENVIAEKGEPIAPLANQPAEIGPGWLSPADIAKKYGLNQDSLRKRLDRFRRNHADGWMEVPNSERTQRGPKYLYREDAIKSVIDDMQTP